MPLVSDGKGKAVAHSELQAIGFWMTVKGASRIQVVRARPRRKGEQRRHLKPQPSNTRLRPK